MNFVKTGGKLLSCFSQDELARLLEIDGKKRLRAEMIRRNLSFDDLDHQPQKMAEVALAVSQKNSADRDIHEIFLSVFVFHQFYESGSEICFELPKFDPRRDNISSLGDLNRFREGSETDFIFKSGAGLRQFQLKRYRGKLSAPGILNFIKEKVAHYGNDLGDVNLLMIFQSSDSAFSHDSFYWVHEELKRLNLKFGGWILISYNENMQFNVINQVYPDLVTTRIPFHLPSSRART